MHGKSGERAAVTGAGSNDYIGFFGQALHNRFRTHDRHKVGCPFDVPPLQWRKAIQPTNNGAVP
jgi:hypothetical protein